MSNGPIRHIVTVISNDVVARLATADYPELVDGRILLGRQYVFEQSAPPRIIFIPVDHDYQEVDVYTNDINTLGGAERRAQIQQRSIATDHVRFQIRCWGVGAEVDDDFDATRGLAHAVIQSIRDCLGPFTQGGVEILKGKWTDAEGGASQLVKYGREYVFGVSIATPILDELLRFPAANVAAKPTTIMQTPTGETSETGCSG